MTSRLILFTANYPFTYNGGETMFVAPEIPWLCRRFDEVVVVPLHDGGEQLPLPPGGVLDRGLARRWRKAAAWYLLKALIWPGFFSEAWRGLMQGGWVGGARVWRWAGVAAATRAWLAQQGRSGHSCVYSYWRGGQTLAAVRWAQRGPDCVAVTRVHGYDLYAEAFSPPFQPWRALYENVTLTMTVSQHGLDYLRGQGVPENRLALARLGVAAARRRARASDDGVWRLVSCSSVIGLKRVPLIAMALMALASRHASQRVEWVHFGGGADLAKVRAQMATAPANLSVELAGSVPNRTVIEHYENQAVDAFLLLSVREGLPVVIQEALAHGIPVVATDVGGVSEAVNSNGENGVLLKPNATTAEIVSALERLLLASDEERSARREAAWRTWGEKFDSDHNHAATASRLSAL